MKTLALIVMLAAAPAAADMHPLETLLRAAHAHSPELAELLPASLPSIQSRGGSAVWGQDFLFAIDTPATATISIDRQPALAMRQVPGTTLWYLTAKLRTGVTHAYEFFADGEPMGPMYSYDVAGYNLDSHPMPGIPQGTTTPTDTLVSRIYDGMATTYRIYAAPGVDPAQPSPVMIWQDGETMVGAADLVRMRLAIVTGNLVHQGTLPPLVHVLATPGEGARGRMYGGVSDTYGRYLLEELLPAVNEVYRLRTDGYSRGIGGLSAGGICAFNAAWNLPDEFSRVYSHSGAFARLTEEDDHFDGSYLYPARVRREPRKNLRVWLSSGTYDYESVRFSLPLQNIQLANSLKLREYDFHFRFGHAMHSVGQAALDLPEVLAWLWRDYDPARREQQYEMEPTEAAQPVFRVKVTNRDSW